MSIGKRILLGAVGLVLGACICWMAVDGFGRVGRLDTNPHAAARIANTWTTTGRYAGRYADLRFADASGSDACLARGVRLGYPDLEAEIGENVEIAPIPGSCADPDFPFEAKPKFVLSLQLAVGLTLLSLGLWRMSGLPPLRATA